MKLEHKSSTGAVRNHQSSLLGFFSVFSDFGGKFLWLLKKHFISIW
jgi:hypothetical protein